MLIPRRVRVITTMPDGHLPSNIILDPSTEYVLFVEELTPTVNLFTSRQHLVAWIDGCVLGDLRTLLKGIDLREAGDEASKQHYGGGNFLLAGGCCMALEYFGQVYCIKGDATSRAKKYVDDFLRPIDNRYSDVFWVLWSTFRNGIVHGSWPQGLCIRGQSKRIAVGVGNSVHDAHLGRDPKLVVDNFVVSAPRFLQDLDSSFSAGFRDWILNQADDDVLNRGNPRLLEINPRNEEGVSCFNIIQTWNRGTSA
jgi:hypothetical protein